MKKTKYNFFLKITAFLVVFIFIFQLVPINQASALDVRDTADAKNVLGTGEKPSGFALGFLWAVNAVMTATLTFMAIFLRMAGGFFDAAMGYNYGGFRDVRSIIQIGWTLSRDVANMFFIIILLFIAIATILRFESYNARRLLPKLIIIALLINFSLTIGYVIIDFTNLLSKGFYEAITVNSPDGMAASLTAATGISNVFNLKNAPGSTSSYWQGGLVGGAIAGCGVGVGFGVIGCLPGSVIGAFTGLTVSAVKWLWWDGNQNFENGVKYFYTVLVSNIIVFPLIFVLVVGAIFLLIRFAVLFMLLILAPLAFIAHILPDTENLIWKKWWDTFLHHAFFMPAFMFMLYMSMMIINKWALNMSVENVQANPGWVATTFAATVFLIGSLMIAQKMGIYGAQKVMQTAKTARQYATGYAGAMAIRNTVGWVGEKAGQKEWVQKSYVGSRLAKGMTQYKGQGIFAKPGQSREDVAGKRAKFDLESTFKKAPNEWHKDFANNKSYAYREAFARDVMGNPKRLEQFMKNADAGIKGDMLNIVRLKLGADAEKTFQKAERTNKLSAALAGGESVSSFMDGIPNEAQQREYFKDWNARDQAELFSQWQADPAKRALIQNWAKTELKPEDQEKFFVESMRKATPALKGEMFNGLAQDRQNKVIESMSPREVVEMRQNAGTHMAVVEDAIKRMPTDKQDRIREEEARGMTKDLDKVATDWATLSEEQKEAAAKVLNKDDLQKVADKVADKDKFINDIQKHAPNKTADIIAVLPEFAGKIGKSPEEVVDWDKVSSKNPNLKSMMTRVQGKGVRKIMERGDTVTSDYINEINLLGDNVDDIVDALEKKHGNSGMAAMLRMNPRTQELVILPEKRIRRGAVTAMQEEAMSGGGSKGGGTGGSGGKGGGGGTGSGVKGGSGGESGMKILEEIRTAEEAEKKSSSPPAHLVDISSPSVKAGYSFKNDFEGDEGSVKYAIEQSEKQVKKAQNLSPAAPSGAEQAEATRSADTLTAKDKAEIISKIEKKTEETKQAIKKEIQQSARTNPINAPASTKEAARGGWSEEEFKYFLKRNNIGETEEAIRNQLEKVQELQSQKPDPARDGYLKNIKTALEYIKKKTKEQK